MIASLGSMLAAVCSAAAAPLQLVYRVSHPVVGELGSYTCTVQQLGNGGSEVRSREHIDARMFGVAVYRMDATGTERWQGSRLMTFDGVTEVTNGRIEIKGEAQGNHFVFTSPQGTFTTAANVHPAGPCAPDFIKSTTILRPDTGTLEQVRVSGGAPGTTVIGGTPIATRKYVLDGKTRYTVWLDSRNVPVMFVIGDSTGQATFTLAKCVSCDLALPRLGMN